MVQNYGERHVDGYTDLDVPVMMPMQVGQVNKVLCAVNKCTGAGNKVVFDDDESYIEHKKTVLLSTDMSKAFLLQTNVLVLDRVNQ